MSEGKIDLTIGLNGSAISADIQKVSGQVGKATTGMAKGISAAMGQSLGPFGELIEKADALKAAFGSITTGSKLLAGGIAIAGVAAVYSVTKAVEAYKEMSKAQDEAAESAERLAKAQSEFGKNVSGTGIAADQVDRLKKNVEGRIADLQKSNAEKVSFIGQGGHYTGNKLNDEQIAANNAKIAELQALITPEAIAKLTEKGEDRLGGKQLTKEADRAAKDAVFEETVANMPTTDLAALRMQRAANKRELINISQQTRTQDTAKQQNEAAAWGEQLDRLIMALEEKADAEEKFTKAYLDASEEVKVEKAKKEAPGVNRPSINAVPTGYGVGGYTSTGGGGNIYGNRAGMEDRVNKMASDVAAMREAIVNGGAPLLTQ